MRNIEFKGKLSGDVDQISRYGRVRINLSSAKV